MIIPADDPEIAGEDTLLRRIPDSPRMITVEADGRRRPTSAALELRKEKDERYCSVDAQKRLRDPTNPFITLEGHPDTWGLASFIAGDARRDGMHVVVGDPRDDNPAHTQVIPTAESKTAQKRNFGEIAKRMTFLREPAIEPAS